MAQISRAADVAVAIGELSSRGVVRVSLVIMGRVRLHRRVANVGIAYGALVLAIGLPVSFVAPVLHVRAGEWTLDRAAGFILLPLVHFVSVGVLAVAFVRIFFMESEGWLKIGRVLLVSFV